MYQRHDDDGTRRVSPVVIVALVSIAAITATAAAAILMGSNRVLIVGAVSFCAILAAVLLSRRD